MLHALASPRVPEDIQSHLPPRDVWLVEPNHVVPTYPDSFGLVDIEQLVADVQAIVDPSYQWSSHLDVHHFQWPNAWYPHEPNVDASDNPAYFRNIGILKGLVPIDFHALVHRFTEPLPRPDPEVMHYKVEAWTVAKNLFNRMKETISSERKARRRLAYSSTNPGVLKAEYNGEDRATQEWMQDVLEKNFRGMAIHIAALERVPAEFRLVEPNIPANKMAGQLGKFIVPKAISPKQLGFKPESKAA